MCDLPLTSTRRCCDVQQNSPDDDTTDGNQPSGLPEPIWRYSPPPPLCKAITESDLPRARALLQADPSVLHTETYFGLPPLQLACHLSDLHLADLLLRAGAKVHEIDEWGRTALHAAAMEHWREGAQLLLAYGASVNAMAPVSMAVKGILRESPLHHSIRTGDLPMTLLMLGISDTPHPTQGVHPESATPNSGIPGQANSGDANTQTANHPGPGGVPVPDPLNPTNTQPNKATSSVLARIATPSLTPRVPSFNPGVISPTGSFDPGVVNSMGSFDPEIGNPMGSLDPGVSNSNPRHGVSSNVPSCRKPPGNVIPRLWNQINPSRLDDSDGGVGEAWQTVLAKTANSASAYVDSWRPVLAKSSKALSLHSDTGQDDILANTKPDLSLKDGLYRTVVHLAAVSKSPAMMKTILSFKKECESLSHLADIKGNNPYHSVFSSILATTHEADIITCLNLLEPLEIDINGSNVKGETPLFLATKKRLSECVLHLISKGANVKITNNLNWSVLHAACSKDAPKCLQHLLDTRLLQSHVFSETNEGHVPFYFATCSYSVECLKILLNNGDHLTNTDSKGITRCSMLLDNIPSANKFLEEMFDDHITVSEKRPHEAEFSLTFDYSLLMSQKFDCVQCSVVSELTSSSSDTILTHPLIESFLFLKWSRIKPFFYCNFVVYILFLILHTFYVLRTFGRTATNWFDALAMLSVFRCFYIIVFLLILIPDLIIMIANVKKYLLQWETYAKVVTLSTSAFIVFSHSVEQPGTMNDMMVERHVAAVSIFFSWIELMMLLGRFPVLGIYILMFTRVAKSIIKFLLAFSSLLIGFALAFEIIFRNDNSFRNFPASIVKTLMMMVGEIDYTAIVEDNGMDMPVLGYMFLVLFLFLVPILMANLLIGLAVSDLPDLSRQGTIKRLSKLAAYLTAYELLMLFFKEMRCFPHYVRVVLAERCRIKKRFTSYPNKRSVSRKKLFQKWIESLPSETLTNATEIAEKRRALVPVEVDEDLEGHGDIVVGVEGLYPGMEGLHPGLHPGVGALHPGVGMVDGHPIPDLRPTQPIPKHPREIVRSLSTVSKNTIVSHDNTPHQPTQTPPYFTAFEEQYKKDFLGLKHYIRSTLTCALAPSVHHDPDKSTDKAAQPAAVDAKEQKRSTFFVGREDRRSTKSSVGLKVDEAHGDSILSTLDVLISRMESLESRFSSHQGILEKFIAAQKN